MNRLNGLIDYVEVNGGLRFSVRVVPGTSKSEIAGEFNGALRVRVAAAPQDGAANAELTKLLARTFDVSRRSVEIIRGNASRAKQIFIHGADGPALVRIISAL